MNEHNTAAMRRRADRAQLLRHFELGDVVGCWLIVDFERRDPHAPHALVTCGTCGYQTAIRVDNLRANRNECIWIASDPGRHRRPPRRASRLALRHGQPEARSED